MASASTGSFVEEKTEIVAAVEREEEGARVCWDLLDLAREGD
jgi:hypothetical protein